MDTITITQKEGELPSTENMEFCDVQSHIAGCSVHETEANVLLAFEAASEAPALITDQDGDAWVLTAQDGDWYTYEIANETRNQALRDLRHRTNAVPQALRIWSDKTNKEMTTNA